MKIYSPQLPLGIELRSDASYDNYIWDDNAELHYWLKKLEQGSEERCVVLWGGASSGKTHLLQAFAQQLGLQNKRATYIPLKQYKELSPDVFEDLELLDAVLLDDLGAISGHREWEEALFHLYNRMKNTKNLLLISAVDTPARINLLLPDLSSRLQASGVVRINPLADTTKSKVLTMLASRKGIVLTIDVANYLINRYPRDMTTLSTLLNELDKASLIAQRKLTIPFVKEVLTQ
ncbi:DnaA inactivator Hda (shorter homolog of DnaA) [hydrothermal vent metagenome]|uniref:DnaA inactivator Hda (Shorter homolog of DnaA) n=1 Tax=hydrothermal vent metagenome TaxID=652676 RepID=A0A3B0ZJ98_9ZZZZ